MAFTLMEIVMVVVILGILATLTIPPFNRVMERARDNEARTNLLLIQAAERVYQAENGVFFPAVGITESNLTVINSTLNLNLNANQWQYRIQAPATLPATDPYQAWAKRYSPDYSNGGFNREFSLLSNGTTPTCTGTCP